MTRPLLYEVVRRTRERWSMFDARCRVCSWTARGWDYRRNAVNAARQHIVKNHV